MRSRSGWLPLAALAFALSTTRAAEAAPGEALPTPLRPDDVVAWAKTHRAEVGAAKAKAAALAHTPKVVSGLPDPMVMVSVDHVPIKLGGIDGSVLVQQDFPISGILGKKKQAAEAEAGAAGADALRVTADVELEALLAYLMVVEGERTILVVDEQLGTAKLVVAAALARLESGGGEATEVVRARLDVIRLEGERKALDAELIGTRQMLNAALARELEGKVPETALVLPKADPPELSKLTELALAQRPELAVQKAKGDKALADVDVMKSMSTPMAFVRAGPTYRMADGPGVMLMVGFSVPLWGDKLTAGVSEAKGMVTMIDADTVAMRKMIEGQVALARSAVVAARVRHETARDKLVPATKQAVSLTLSSYASGKASQASVLDTVAMLRTARLEEVVAEIRVAVAWARLGRALGVVKIGV